MTTTETRWEPLAPGALGADPTDTDADALIDDLPPLPLTGPLAEALHTARTALDTAHTASHHTATLTPEQRLTALQQVAAARHVNDAVLLRLTATFTPDDLRTLGATTVIDLLLTHTGADPTRAATEAKLAAALTAPPLRPPAPPADEPTLDADADADAEDDDGEDGDEDGDVAAPAGPVMGPVMGPVTGPVTGPGAGSSTVTLGALGLAHAAGTVSTDIAALAARTLASLPARIRRTCGPAADAALAQLLPGLDHARARTVCTTLAHTLDPDRADGSYDPDDAERRYLNTTIHDDGWMDVRARLDPVTAAALKVALDHLSKPEPTVLAPIAAEADDDTDTSDDDTGTSGRGGQTSVPVRDQRTAPQRRADALGVLARQGLSTTTTRGGEVPRIIVTTTDAQIAGRAGAGQATLESTGRTLTRAALLHLACSGVIQAVRMSCDGPDAAVLSLGRAVRLFTASQRRAMLARDGGCVIPGCTAPPGWLEAHHVHAWADGGPTDVGSGVLLCFRHHLLVTLGAWQVRMVNGVPQVRPPRGVDPLRRWLSSPRRSLTHTTAELVELGAPPACGGLLLDPPGGWADEPPDHPGHEHPGSAAPDIPSPRQTCDC